METPTSLLIRSCEEIKAAMESGFRFPAVAIPFGAHHMTPCRFFISIDEIFDEDIALLLENSYPMRDGVRKIHIISVSNSSVWLLNPKSTFYLAST